MLRLRFCAMDQNALAQQLTKMWYGVTLAEFRAEAEHETSGILTTSIREPNGPRRLFVVCVTDMDQIYGFEKLLGLVAAAEQDWNSCTLVEVAVRAIVSGSTFELLSDEFGRHSALLLIAAEPHSIEKLESIFEIPS